MAEGQTVPPLNTTRWIVCGLAATVLPAAIMFLLDLIVRRPEAAPSTDGFFLALLVGLVAVWNCPLSLWGKIVACILYVPIMAFLLVMGFMLFGFLVASTRAFFERNLPSL